MKFLLKVILICFLFYKGKSTLCLFFSLKNDNIFGFCIMNFGLLLETLAVEEYRRDGLVEISRRMFHRSSSEMVKTSGFLIQYLLIILYFLNRYFDNN